MKTLIATAMAGAMVAAAPAGAQIYQPNYQQDQYSYEQSRRDYERALRDYEAARAQYERDRAAWERRYGGGGGYAPGYGYPPAPPVYGDNRYPPPPPPYYGGDNRYPGYGSGDPYQPGGFDPYDSYRNNDCERRYGGSAGGDRTAGTVIGALIGGALGAAVAGDSSETEGAVLGAVVGGTIGYNIAGNPSTANRYAAQCDANGYYFTSDQTFAYRESDLDRRGRSGRYDYNYYARQGCRLAIAPASSYGGQANYRYVRVCPDRQGRYRITS